MYPRLSAWLRGPAVRVILIGVWGFTLVSVCAVGDTPRPESQRLAVPAYWSLASDGGRAQLGRLVRGGPAIVVVNGARSAPQVPYDPAWAGAVRTLGGAGVLPLGYVDTGYLGIDFGSGSAHTRTDGPGGGRWAVDDWARQIKGDVDAWYALYAAAGLRGVFLDQTPAVCGPDNAYVDRYRQLVERVRHDHPGAYVVMNPGRSVEPCYRSVADTLVTFEGSYRDYLTRPAAAWEATVPAGAFWHLVYGAPDEASMVHAVGLSKLRNAGYVYVTDTPLPSDGHAHPWDAIPPDGYWRVEQDAVSRPTN